MTEELVNEIVRKVLAEMQQRGLAATPAAAKPTRPAPAQPAPPLRPKPRVHQPPPPRRVFVTAEILAQRLAAAGAGQGRTVELARNEFLTPAAVDLVEDRHLTVVRIEAKPTLGGTGGRANATNIQRPDDVMEDMLQAGTLGGSSLAAAGPKSLGMVIRQPNATLRSVLDGLSRSGIEVAEFAASDCWIVNTRAMCAAVAGGRVAGGVAMVPVAAEAVILANKVRGIRAVQGVRLDSLTTAVARIAPNLLVLEHSSCTFHELRTMLRAFASGLATQGKNEAVLGAIGELERS